MVDNPVPLRNHTQFSKSPNPSDSRHRLGSYPDPFRPAHDEEAIHHSKTGNFNKIHHDIVPEANEDDEEGRIININFLEDDAYGPTGRTGDISTNRKLEDYKMQPMDPNKSAELESRERIVSRNDSKNASRNTPEIAISVGSLEKDEL